MSSTLRRILLEVKLLLRNFLTTFLMALEGNKFFLNVLVRLFMSR